MQVSNKTQGREVTPVEKMLSLKDLTKEEVRVMADYPGVQERLGDIRLIRLFNLYNLGKDARKSIETVVTRSAYDSVKSEEKSGRKDTKFEKKLHLYLNGEIKTICIDSKVIGAQNMIYAIDELNENLKNDESQTIGVIKLMGELKTKESLGYAVVLMHIINEKIKALKDYEDPVQSIKQYLLEESEFMGQVRKFSSISRF